MRSLAIVAVLLLAAALSASAQPTRPPTAPPAEQKPAVTPPVPPTDAKATASIVHNPLSTPKDGKAALLGKSDEKSADVNATDRSIANRYLIVSGNGQYTLWANLAQIFVAVEPRIFQSIAANATVEKEPNYLPDAKAKDEIKQIYAKVLDVLQKFNAIDISSSPSFVSSPMFEPNTTAFRMFMQHQSQMMQRRRSALAQRVGRNLLLRGRPLSMHDQPMSQRGRGLMHRSSIRDVSGIDAIRGTQMDVEDGVEQPVTASKPEEAKKDSAIAAKPEKSKEPEKPIAAEDKKEPIADAKKPEKKKEEIMVPLPDPKSLITFKGFRFYRPLSAMVPIESVMEVAQALRAVNATIESVQLAVHPKTFDEARAYATKAAIERGLAVADAALGAAHEQRGKVSTVLINTSNPPRLPRLPMFRAAFLRPQSITVNSQVALRVAF